MLEYYMQGKTVKSSATNWAGTNETCRLWKVRWDGAGEVGTDEEHRLWYTGEDEKQGSDF